MMMMLLLPSLMMTKQVMKREGFANTIKWREVIENVWLRVEYLVDVNTQYGPAMVVGLLNGELVC